MAVASFQILSREPYDGGTDFGSVGAYEQINAVVDYAVDPAHPQNSGIVDLAQAERGGDGLVHFRGDAVLLQPADPLRGQRALLLEVPNRGRRTATGMFNRSARTFEPTPEIDAGDGFLFREGWSVGWCGWQWDVPRDATRMGLDVPILVDPAGAPVADWLQLRLQLHAPCASVNLTDQHVGSLGVHKRIPAADIDDPEAKLLARDRLWDEPVELGQDQWRFARADGDTVVADPEHVWLRGGFEPGRIYDLVYRTGRCPVAGVGLLAVRDLAAFFSSDGDANPAAGRIDHVVGTGQSQCGRFLRTFLHLGLNRTEDGGRAFDGILAHIAGGRRGEFNHRLAQPSVQPTPSFGHRFPFADNAQTDPRSGNTDGLLARLQEAGSLPKVIYTNTAAEYWRGDASLAHTSVIDGGDVALPDETRHYLFASTQHGPGSLPLMDLSLFGSRGGNCFNVVDYTPLMRAALTNLLRWVADDTAPPPSVVPRASEGTATRREQVLDAVSKIPGMARPDGKGLCTLRPMDLGPGEASGVGSFPARPLGDEYPCRVSAVDADGNELGGIRMPDVTVPVATHTGWNPRHASTGASDQLLEYLGSTIPFAVDRQTREARGDPRASLEERYRDAHDYLDRVREAAKQLATQGYLLAADVELCVRLAKHRYAACTS